MILTRTPLRISFVGGGSDRPSFYQEEPGACVAAAIDKYVYVAVNGKYDGSIRAAYSITENVDRADQLQHELIREALRLYGTHEGTEIHSIADIPGGTGLGSSSSFMVGLVKALDLRDDVEHHPYTTANIACSLEIERCQKPIGKQDQYTAAYGGLNLLGFSPKGVTVDSIACDLDALSSHCLLLDTGMARQGDAGAVLALQQQDRDDVRTLAHLARSFASALASGNYRLCGAQMDAAWMVKREYCSTPVLDHWYTVAEDAGAWGGKLCGAGGGGFLLFLAPPERHTTIITALGLRHVPIRVGVSGSEVVWAAR
jgi:D-glycero-alpha-D-manno-heptose-7-phosphate kinase